MPRRLTAESEPSFFSRLTPVTMSIVAATPPLAGSRYARSIENRQRRIDGQTARDFGIRSFAQDDRPIAAPRGQQRILQARRDPEHGDEHADDARDPDDHHAGTRQPLRKVQEVHRRNRTDLREHGHSVFLIAERARRRR